MPIPHSLRLTLLLLIVISNASFAQSVYTLQSAVVTAKAYSPLLKAAGYNINLAQGNLTTARLHTNPALNNQSLQQLNSKYYPAGTETFNPLNRQVWWQLTKPFVLPSQRQGRIDIATQNIGLYQQGFSETIRNFSSDVANQWLNTWIIKSRMELLDQAYANIDSLVKINKARLRNQAITQTDLLRTQLLQEQYKLQIINAQKNFQNELRRLQFFIGVNDSINVDVNGAVESTILPGDVDTLMNMAMEQRSDVKAAKLAVTLAQTNIKYQKSMAWPQPELGMIWNPQNTIPYMGFFGTIKVPLFDRNQGEIEKSKFQQLQAEEGVRNTQLKLTTEVQAAFQSYQVEKENLKKYEQMLAQSDIVLDNVRYAYLKGGTTIIDFLDAQRSWFDTRQLYLNARLSYFQSYIQLLYVTGLINQL
jgi:cobalt-zinc-cadmium efflux system outer membrane protein